MEHDNRRPYVEVFIKDIKKDDFKVAVSGTIVNKTEKSFLLDDGTGQARVAAGEVAEHHEYVRVFGRVIPYEEGIEIEADVVQDLGKINRKLHKKLKEMMSKTA